MADQEYDNERRPVQNRSNATIAMQSNPSYSASNNADNTTNLLNKSQTYCQSDGAYVIEDITSTVPPPYSTRQQEAIPQGRANSRQVHYAENAPNEEYYTALDMDGTSVFYERVHVGDTHSAHRGAPILPLSRSHGQPPPGTANSQPSIREQPAVVRHPQVSIAHDRQMNSTIETTSLPKYALVIGVVTTIVFSTVLFWLPGLVCLIPAIGLAIAGIVKKEKQKIGEARKYGIISLVILLIFYISYPIVVTLVVVASVFGYINATTTRTRS